MTHLASALALSLLLAPPADPPAPLLHLPLATDANDTGPHHLPTKAVGVRFENNQALFDGQSHIQVDTSKLPALGNSDFSISFHFDATDTTGSDSGSLLSWYDPDRRNGINITLSTPSGVTTNQPAVRQLSFGIDAGSEPRLTDLGRPGNATIAFGLAVHEGALYAATASNAPDAVGHVYRHDGGTTWVDCGAPDSANALTALAVFEGRLYTASSKYRFAGSALPESPNTQPGGRVFRYEGGTRWTDLGQLPGAESIGGLVGFRGRLHASSLYKPAGFYRLEPDGRWTTLPTPDNLRVEALSVFQGDLWASSYDGGHVFRYDGTQWHRATTLDPNTQTYSFAVHHNLLHVGTWPTGRVYRLEPDRTTWTDLGRLGSELEVMGMLVHNGKLYAGSLPLAELYRYDGPDRWTRLAQLDTTPDVKYRRAWTMAQHQGRLIISTLPTGHVWALESGPTVTLDHPLPPGPHHLTATRRNNRLELHLDGHLAAQSPPFNPTHFPLTPTSPLTLATGPTGNLIGQLQNVRLEGSATKRD